MMTSTAPPPSSPSLAGPSQPILPPTTTTTTGPPTTIEHPLSTSSPIPASPPSPSQPPRTGSPVIGLAPVRSISIASRDRDAITPPVPLVHLRVLIISGQSHVFTFEPETTVGRMKELIWSMWPSDWNAPAQPPSPSFLRVLHAGRVLQDDSTLSSNNLPVALPPAIPTVIHISVRSFSIRNEDDPKKGNIFPTTSRTRQSNAENEVGGCRCTIM